MLISSESIAFAGTPVQWAVLAFIVLLMFAPRMLPALARRFGDLFIAHTLRRIGLPINPPIRRPRPPHHEIEVVESKPLQPAATRESEPASVQGSTPPRSFWLAGTIVAGAAAVLLWLLLRTR